MLKLRRSTDERCGSDRRRSGKTLEIIAALGAGPVTAAYVLVLLTFGLDAMLPLGTAIWFFYLIPIGFVAMWSSPTQSSHVMVLAGICTVLTWAGFFLPSWRRLACYSQSPDSSHRHRHHRDAVSRAEARRGQPQSPRGVIANLLLLQEDS